MSKKENAENAHKNFNIQQTPGVLQAAALHGMSPLSLMDAQKNMASGDNDGDDDVPIVTKMYPSAARP